MSGEQRRRWRNDAQVAARLVEEWESTTDTVAVRISRAAAELAVEAWERPGEAEDEVSGSSDADTTSRHAAGALALIGAALADRGRWGDAEVTVDVPLVVVCGLVRSSAGTGAPVEG